MREGEVRERERMKLVREWMSNMLLHASYVRERAKFVRETE